MSAGAAAALAVDGAVLPLRLGSPPELAVLILRRQVDGHVSFRIECLLERLLEALSREGTHMMPWIEFQRGGRRVVAVPGDPLLESAGQLLLLKTGASGHQRRVRRLVLVLRLGKRFRLHVDTHVSKADVGKARCQAVVVVLRQGIEFMAVTTAAAECQAEQRCPQRAHHVARCRRGRGRPSD